MDRGTCSRGAYILMGRKLTNKKTPGIDTCYDDGSLISVEWSGKASQGGER